MHGRCINGFSEKLFVWSKCAIWDPDWCILPHNSGSTVKIVLQFCTMKEAKRDMGIILMVFWKEVLFRAIRLFGNKNSMTSSYLWICSQVFLLILHNKRDHEVHENFIICFLRKNLIWINLIFLCHFLMFDWVWSKLSQATFTIGSLIHYSLVLLRCFQRV